MYFKGYYPNKLICPCQLVTVINDKIHKYTGVILPWDEETAYEEDIITRYKTSYQDLDFILFYSHRVYGYITYKIVSVRNNKSMIDEVCTVLSYKYLSSKLMCSASKLKINDHYAAVITTTIELFTTKQAFSISKIIGSSIGSKLNKKISTLYNGELTVGIVTNPLDFLGERTINYIEIKMKHSISDIEDDMVVGVK